MLSEVVETFIYSKSSLSLTNVTLFVGVMPD